VLRPEVLSARVDRPRVRVVRAVDAATDVVAGLQHDDRSTVGSELPGCGQTREAGAAGDDVTVETGASTG
jgi:hypothetical protein